VERWHRCYTIKESSNTNPGIRGLGSPWSIPCHLRMCMHGLSISGQRGRHHIAQKLVSPPPVEHYHSEQYEDTAPSPPITETGVRQDYIITDVVGLRGTNIWPWGRRVLVPRYTYLSNGTSPLRIILVSIGVISKIFLIYRLNIWGQGGLGPSASPFLSPRYMQWPGLAMYFVVVGNGNVKNSNIIIIDNECATPWCVLWRQRQ
jgi:hypothetical protein